MESISTNDHNNNYIQRKKGRKWTNERHSNFLSLMEASFVRTMFGRSYVHCKDNNFNNNFRIDRFVPDIAESTLDLQSSKSIFPGAICVLDAVTTTGSTQRQRLRSHPYNITHDQVVPQLEDETRDKCQRVRSEKYYNKNGGL